MRRFVSARFIVIFVSRYSRSLIEPEVPEPERECVCACVCVRETERLD